MTNNPVDPDKQEDPDEPIRELVHPSELDDYEAHSFAASFSRLSDEELDVIGEDIMKDGQKDDVIVVGKTIVDGLNRLEACRRKDIKVWIIRCVMTEELILKTIVQKNQLRRHSTTAERAVTAAAFKFRMGCKVTWPQVARIFKVSRRSAFDARAKLGSDGMPLPKDQWHAAKKPRPAVVEPVPADVPGFIKHLAKAATISNRNLKRALSDAVVRWSGELYAILKENLPKQSGG